MIYSIEAGRLMAGGADNNNHAERLLRLALEEMDRVNADDAT